jgi:hypothetical protein
MGTDRFERNFLCLCGKGEILAEWSEHDTWPSPNKSIGWSFICDDCDAKYAFSGDVIILRADADKYRELWLASEAANNKVYPAAAKCEERWLRFVMACGTKKEMNRLVGSGSYGTFLKYASRPGWIENQTRLHFKVSPKACLDHMGINDAEVSALHEAASAARKTADEFWRTIEKKDVPRC